MTTDEHDHARFITIDGRRWRRTDPAIPDRLRDALVDELMAARRSLRGARKTPDHERAARARVDTAKRALGERGPEWWLPATEAAVTARLDALVRALANASATWSREELIAASHADELPNGRDLTDAATRGRGASSHEP